MPWYDRALWGLACLSVSVFAAALLPILGVLTLIWIAVHGSFPWDD